MHESSLTSRAAAVRRSANGLAFRQRPPRDFDALLIKIIAQDAKEREAIGIDPERDHRLRIERVDRLTELRRRPQRLLERFAAQRHDWLDGEAAQAVAKINAVARAVGVAQSFTRVAAAHDRVLEAKRAAWPRHAVDAEAIAQ